MVLSEEIEKLAEKTGDLCTLAFEIIQEHYSEKSEDKVSIERHNKALETIIKAFTVANCLAFDARNRSVNKCSLLLLDYCIKQTTTDLALITEIRELVAEIIRGLEQMHSLLENLLFLQENSNQGI